VGLLGVRDGTGVEHIVFRDGSQQSRLQTAVFISLTFYKAGVCKTKQKLVRGCRSYYDLCA